MGMALALRSRTLASPRVATFLHQRYVATNTSQHRQLKLGNVEPAPCLGCSETPASGQWRGLLLAQTLRRGSCFVVFRLSRTTPNHFGVRVASQRCAAWRAKSILVRRCMIQQFRQPRFFADHHQIAHASCACIQYPDERVRQLWQYGLTHLANQLLRLSSKQMTGRAHKVLRYRSSRSSIGATNSALTSGMHHPAPPRF